MSELTGWSASTPMAEVELTMSCRDLADGISLWRSDPFVVVSIADKTGCTWSQVKRTEVVHGNHNPNFATKLVINYRFEDHQVLRFEVYTTDGQSDQLLGLCLCSLGELVSRRVTSLPLTESRRGRGSLLVQVEQLLASRQLATLRVSAVRLDNKRRLCGKSCPYVELSKTTECGGHALVWRSEVQRDTLSPSWPMVDLSVAALCNGDLQRNLRATCWHRRSSGAPVLIGQADFTLEQLKHATGQQLELINPEKQKKKSGSYKNSGLLTVGMKLQEVSSFLDYIQGGTELACTVAIDFTASNGNPSSPESLHYLGGADGEGGNPYMVAIRAVASVLQDYDSNKHFPVLGFGAKVPPDGTVSHEFFVNLHPSNPYCFGVEGVVSAYQQCLPQIELYGPTNFAPVINHVAKFGRQFKGGTHYFILLIITDGVITDMPETKEALVEASYLPVSIIIVGVGAADFSAMKQLDGNRLRVRSGRRVVQRDIVHFVQLSQLQTVDGGFSALLARELLAEVPQQVLTYMKINAIEPGPPRRYVEELPPDPLLNLS